MSGPWSDECRAAERAAAEANNAVTAASAELNQYQQAWSNVFSKTTGDFQSLLWAAAGSLVAGVAGYFVPVDFPAWGAFLAALPAVIAAAGLTATDGQALLAAAQAGKAAQEAYDKATAAATAANDAVGEICDGSPTNV